MPLLQLSTTRLLRTHLCEVDDSDGDGSGTTEAAEDLASTGDGGVGGHWGARAGGKTTSAGGRGDGSAGGAVDDHQERRRGAGDGGDRLAGDDVLDRGGLRAAVAGDGRGGLNSVDD